MHLPVLLHRGMFLRMHILKPVFYIHQAFLKRVTNKKYLSSERF
jgi:hemolysin-activating ACP:hemolysin acyltransferase